MRRTLAVLLIGAACSAHAARKPSAPPRLVDFRFEQYQPFRAIPLCVRPGLHATVDLGHGARITDWTIGFDEAWLFSEVPSAPGTFTLKQRRADPLSDLVVYAIHPTVKRVRLFFDLRVCTPTKLLTIQYDQYAATLPVQPDAAPAPVERRNYAYRGAAQPGAEDLEPTVYDDGEHTYFAWPRHVKMPEVRRIEGGGDSVAAFTNLGGNRIVVHGLSDRWELDSNGRRFCIEREHKVGGGK